MGDQSGDSFWQHVLQITADYLQLGVIINLDLLLAASGWVGYIELHTGPNYPGPTTHKTQALKRASLATVRTCKAWRLMTFITYVAAERECTQHANAFAMAINQFTFLVFGTHQGSQQTITGKTTYTKH